MKLFSSKLIEQLRKDFNETKTKLSKRQNAKIVYYKKDDKE